jgi:hypothetical protein
MGRNTNETATLATLASLALLLSPRRHQQMSEPRICVGRPSNGGDCHREPLYLIISYVEGNERVNGERRRWRMDDQVCEVHLGPMMRRVLSGARSSASVAVIEGEEA